MRRGLVLEGGGGKGAYQFGCLKAFASRKIMFDAVAGTSVGALNGYLWASSSMSDGDALWSTIKRDRVYPWRIPLWAAHLLAPIVLLSHILTLLSRGHKILPKAARFALLFVIVMPFFYGMYYLWEVGQLSSDRTPGGPLIFVCMGVILIVIGSIEAWSASKLGTYEEFRSIFLTIYVVLVPVICLMMMIFCWHDFTITPGGLTRHELAFKLGPHGILFGIGIGAIVLARAVLSRASVMNQSGLNRTITDLVRNHPPTIPFYVTVASEIRLFDPDAPTYSHPSYGGLITYAPARYLPRYLAINTLQPDEQRLALLASAALPFGIVPPVTLRGAKYVDGGIVDNSPSYPLITFEDCDEIIVLSMNPKLPQVSENSRWRLFDRLFRLEESFADYYQEVRTGTSDKLLFDGVNNPPKHVPFRTLTSWNSVRVLTLRPSRRLGGFLSGTLNFDNRYAATLVRHGYEDALLWLEAVFGLLPNHSI